MKVLTEEYAGIAEKNKNPPRRTQRAQSFLISPYRTQRGTKFFIIRVSDEDVERVVAERIIALPEARLRNRDRLQTERMQCFLPLAQRLGDSEEADLLAMLLGDFYQDTFHGPLIPVERVARMIAQHSSEGANRRHSDGHPHHRSKH